jgi:exodeoxyribonuclease VII large subunit
VGHETDTTIVDYVADLRAPTPSAAAEIAVPDAAELVQDIAALQQHLDATIVGHLADHRSNLDMLRNRHQQHHPAARIAQARQQLDDSLRRARERLERLLALQGERLNSARGQLAALSPQATLRRGYALAQQADTGAIITHSEQVRPGDRLTLRLQQGNITVEVIETQQVERDEGSNP